MAPRAKVQPTQVEVTFERDEVIVSKTDPTGRITYANEVFLRVAGYREAEVLGAPHSLIRHPDMPRGVFRLLWDTLGRGEEVFAYVKNMTRTGDHYWVFAHVTPTYGPNGELVGFHSNRRRPGRAGIEAVEALYQRMVAVEAGKPNALAACQASLALLDETLRARQCTYPELMFALWEGRA